MNTFFATLITVCCFLAATLNLALKTRARNVVMTACAGIAITAGLICYPYIYTYSAGFSAQTVLRSLLSICRMFSGVNDYASASATPLFRYPIVVDIFWLAHFCAFYVTASAAIEVLGRRILKRIRFRLLHRGSLAIVYNATADSAAMIGGHKKGRGVVFVAEREDPALAAMAESLGGVMLIGVPETCVTAAFLKHIGVGRHRRTVDVYCLGDDERKNLLCAEALRDTLMGMSIEPESTSLFLLGRQSRAAELMAVGDAYGYGSVLASEICDLTARMAVRRFPPWRCLPCDVEARAAKDLQICIVGFGQMGCAVLRQMIMNGQMEGSTFRADVFDPRMNGLRGQIDVRYPQLLSTYDIQLHSCEAGCPDFYSTLDERMPDMLILCTGSRKTNRELSAELEVFFAQRNRHPVLLSCTKGVVIADDIEHRIDSVDARAMDHIAMTINHIYRKGPSAEADWRQCDAFSRASCWAAADFHRAFLYAAGVDDQAVLDGHWPPEGAILENLARTEHRRWCAFHLAMGYRTMSDDEFDQRVERYRNGERLRIGKNAESMTHACLVPWEALDALSARENAVTGGSVDYKALDADNVRIVADLVRAASE